MKDKSLSSCLSKTAMLFYFTFNTLFAAAQKKAALPSSAHVEWSDAEIGAIFHFDMPTFKPEYNWRVYGSHPSASVFNPSKVNTDQWIAAAKAGGAKYAVLVAKHGSGFSLWPTAAHAYSVKNSPWKNGQGDLVKDFVESCIKYGVRPGIYASASTNGYLWADNPGVVAKGGPVDQKTYNNIVLQQLTELWSNYGKLFEIWFDGGVIPVSEGGPDVNALLKKLQPDAVVFQGPASAKNLIRWIGNEDGLAPYPNWSTTNGIDATKGFKENDFSGVPGGKIWCPGETDFPLRTGGFQGGWFWVDENQDMISKEKLLDNYVTSVGRNSNMLIGIVVDSSGLVPMKDVNLLKDFGEAVKLKYQPFAVTSGSGKETLLDLVKMQSVKGVVIKEDIARGERIRKYVLEGFNGKTWKSIGGGSSVGHKRIEMLTKAGMYLKVRLRVVDSEGVPLVKEFGVL
jgi:alpha-L-fucosidase